MNAETKLIKSRGGLLWLAEERNNITHACRMMGTSWDSLYRIKERYHTGGEEALREMSRRKPILQKRMAPEVKAAVVDRAAQRQVLLWQNTHGNLSGFPYLAQRKAARRPAASCLTI